MGSFFVQPERTDVGYMLESVDVEEGSRESETIALIMVGMVVFMYFKKKNGE